MKQRVLVLGAAGFIGRRLVAALAATPWAIPVAAIHRSPVPEGPVETVQLDATHEPTLAYAMDAADAVVNCVAGSAAAIVATARAVFAVARRAPWPLRVIHLSSMAVYGAAIGKVDETAQLSGDGGAYASAKVEAEHLAASCAEVVILRPGCVYGPGSTQWSERIARWLTAHRIGDLGVAGDGICNLVHVDDVVAAILAALRLPRVAGHAFNLGSPAPPTWNEYFLSFARMLGAVPLSRISRRRLALETKVWAPPLKLAEMTADLIRLPKARIPSPIPPSLVRSWGQDITLDVGKAEQQLHIAWTPAEAGLRETAGELRARGIA
jgi:nucleoside-diphosphate-sugar epimerase